MADHRAAVCHRVVVHPEAAPRAVDLPVEKCRVVVRQEAVRQEAVRPEVAHQVAACPAVILAAACRVADLPAAVVCQEAVWAACPKRLECPQAACPEVVPAVPAVPVVPVVLAERVVLTAGLREAVLAAEQVATSQAALDSFPVIRIVRKNSVKNWTSLSEILMRRWVRNNARSHR